MRQLPLMLPMAALAALALAAPLPAKAALSAPKAQSVLPRTSQGASFNNPSVDADARWEQVAGCARDIVAGGNGVVYVTGCDVVPNSRGSSGVFRWSGAAFVPLPVPGHGSALATFGGTSYTIGGDAMLYSSINDGEWRLRGTPDRQPITDVGAGRLGIWIITSQPGGEAGNTIARSEPCPSSAIAGGNDYCAWRAVEGAGMRIAVGTAAWVVNAQGGLYEWRSGRNHWVQRPGCFTDVAANGDHVYAVTCSRGQGDGNAIYRWDAAGYWVDVKAAGKRVAVDAAGNAWVVTDSGSIWRRTDPVAPGTPR